MTDDKCIFCNIISGKDKDATILHQDEEIVIIKDKYPVAEHHILVLSKRHIVNSKCLKTDDLSLVEKMNESGLKQMKELNADISDLRSGYHWPPVNTVNHLHQHFISPGSSLGFIRNILFSTRNPWFVNVQYLLKRLAK